MHNPSLQRFHPKADETFFLEEEDFLTSMAQGLMVASFKDCVKGINLLSDSLILKFKEFVATIDNCKSVSFGDGAGVFTLRLKSFSGSVTMLHIEPTWYPYTLRTVGACESSGIDMTFVPRSFKEAVDYFIEAASKDTSLAAELECCNLIPIRGGSRIPLTPETATKYLSAVAVPSYLTSWCRVIWNTLRNGLSIEQAHYFALMSHLTYSGHIKGSQEKWRYRQKPSILASRSTHEQPLSPKVSSES